MSYHLVDKETAITYFLARLTSGDIEQIGNKVFAFNANDVEYFVLSDFTLGAVAPLKRNSYVFTTEVLLEWKNPARVKLKDEKEGYIPISTNYGFTCSNYVCFDTLPQNPMKITKDNLVVLDNEYNVVLPDLEEKIDEIVVKTEENYLGFGIIDKNMIYLLPVFYNFYNVSELAITRGSCLGNENILAIDKKGDMKYEYRKEVTYFCY